MYSMSEKKSFKKRIKKSLPYIITGTIFLFLFFAFTFWVRTNTLESFDFDTTVRLQNNTPLKFDDFFSYLSVIGRFEYTLPFLIFILFLAPRVSMKQKLLGIFLIVGIFGLAHMIEIIGKSTLEQPGPPRMFLRSHFSDFPGLHVFTKASYPSGHSLRIVFLAVIGMILTFKSRLVTPLKLFSYLAILSIVFLMLYSRVSLGEHWITDVIGGALLGISAAFFSLVFLL